MLHCSMLHIAVMRYTDCVYDFEDRKSLGKSKEWRLQMTAKPIMILTIWALLSPINIFFLRNPENNVEKKNQEKRTENTVQLQANDTFRSISNFYSYYSSMFTLSSLPIFHSINRFQIQCSDKLIVEVEIKTANCDLHWFL